MPIETQTTAAPTARGRGHARRQATDGRTPGGSARSRRGLSRVRGGIVVAVFLGLALHLGGPEALPSQALAFAPTPGAVQANVPAPVATGAAAPGGPAGATAPAGTPTPGPTGTPTVTPTRPPKATGIVLVPMAVRPPAAAPNLPPNAAVLRGRVVDYAGRGLWGQVVKTIGPATRTASSDDDGAYEIGGLPAGTYTVVVDQQITTPADGVKLEVGKMTQVDFVQIRPPATATPGRSPTAVPTATPTQTSTPYPTATLTPTSTPRPSPTPISVDRWWSWLGIEIDLGALASNLYLGVVGGVVLFALGLIVALVRR